SLPAAGEAGDDVMCVRVGGSIHLGATGGKEPSSPCPRPSRQYVVLAACTPPRGWARHPPPGQVERRAGRAARLSGGADGECLSGLNRAEQAVRFGVRPGGEEERGRWTRRGVVPELERPEAVEHHRRSGRAVPQLALRREEPVRPVVERGDPAVAEIADQQV